jgi:hypothetical protein
LLAALAVSACTGQMDGKPRGAGGTTGDPDAAGLMPLRRLTAREYLNTVRDLLGDATPHSC